MFIETKFYETRGKRAFIRIIQTIILNLHRARVYLFFPIEMTERYLMLMSTNLSGRKKSAFSIKQVYKRVRAFTSKTVRAMTNARKSLCNR